MGKLGVFSDKDNYGRTLAETAFFNARPAAFLTCGCEASLTSSLESMSMYAGCWMVDGRFRHVQEIGRYCDARSSPAMHSQASLQHPDAYAGL